MRRAPRGKEAIECEEGLFFFFFLITSESLQRFSEGEKQTTFPPFYLYSSTYSLKREHLELFAISFAGKQCFQVF